MALLETCKWFVTKHSHWPDLTTWPSWLVSARDVILIGFCEWGIDIGLTTLVAVITVSTCIVPQILFFRSRVTLCTWAGAGIHRALLGLVVELDGLPRPSGIGLFSQWGPGERAGGPEVMVLTRCLAVLWPGVKFFTQEFRSVKFSLARRVVYRPTVGVN